MRWRTKMEPRVHPDGTLIDYILMKQNYASNLKSNYESAGDWHELGPYSKPSGRDAIGGGRNGVGPVSWISFDPNFETTNLMFTGGWSSGLWYSEDGGDTWQNGGTDHSPPPISTADGISSHTDEDTWFITTGDGRGSWKKGGTRSTGLFRTTDRGQNWEMIGAPWDFGGANNPPPNNWYYWSWELRKLLLNPESNNAALQLFVTGFNGVYRTNNALGSIDNSPAITNNMAWERIFDYNNVPATYTIDGTTYNLSGYNGSNNKYIRIYAYDIAWGYDNAGVDTDKLIISCSPVYENVNDSQDKRQIPFIYASDDQGNTWNLLGMTSPPAGYFDLRRFSLRTCPSDPSLLYAHSSYGDCRDNLCSSDGRVLKYDLLQGEWIGNIHFHDTGDGEEVWSGKEAAFAVSPIDESEFYVTKSIHLQKTLNGGKAFQSIGAPGKFHVDLEDIEYSPDGSQVWLATHGGPFVYDIANDMWYDKMQGIGNTEVLGFSSSKTNPDRILIGANHDGSIYASGNVEPNWMPDWKTVGGGDGQECYIDAENYTISYVTQQYASPKKNSNAYDTWDSQSFDPVIPPPGSYGWYVSIAANPFSSPSIYVAKTNLWRHDNRGESGSPWVNLTDVTSGNFNYDDRTFGTVYRSFPSDVDENLLFAMMLGQKPKYNQDGTPVLDDNGEQVYTDIRDLYGCNAAMGTTTEAQNAWFRIPRPIGNHTPWYPSVVSDPDDHNVFYTLSGFAPLNDENPQTFKIAKFIYNGGDLMTDAPATIETAGFTIEDLTFDFPNLSACDLTIIPGSRDFLAATDMGVFYTNEELMDGNGEVWLAYGENFPYCDIHKMEVNYASNKVRIGTYGRGVWENDLPCDKLDTPIEVSADVEWDNFRRIRNDIHVLPGATLTISGELQMAPESFIQVAPNALLVIDGGRITAACDGMWRGIEVVGNANQPQFEPYQGKVVLTNGGSIENATLGVSLGVKNENGTIDLSTTGGFLNCSNGAKFVNCQRAVRAYDYTGEFANRTKFYNTTFEISDELLDGSNPSYQVQMRGVDGIRFQNCTFTNTRADEFSIFEGGKGIAASNTGFRVEGCLFENLEYGIRVKSIGFDDIKISENTFTGNLGGVSLRYSGLAEVVQNTFNIPAVSDLDIHPSNVAYGIYLGGSTGYAVEENTFYGDNIDQNAGIAIHNSGPEPNRIYNNEFGRLSAGIVAMGNNRGTNIYLGLLFECNDLGSFDYPLGFSLALTNEGEVRHYQGYLGNDGGAANVFEPVCAPTTLQEREFYLGDNTPPDSPVLYFPYAQENTRPDCHTPDMVTVPVSEQVLNKNERCPSNFFNGGSIEEIKDKYVANTSLYQGLQVVYNNEYNGGDIEFLKDLISDPTVSSFDLRNELLLASPKVTSRLLIAAIQRDPAMNPWHLAQVLLANSRLTQDVINALNKSDVHPYYRELVMDGQNGGMSNTAIMESELGHFGGLMEFARTDYVRQLYRADSANTLNDSIIHYLSSDASPQLMKTMMAYHIKRSQWQAAQDLLGEASNLRWSSDYVDLVGILMDALSDSANANAVIESKNTQLLAIAAENNTEAFLAQSILETYELADFPDYIELPTPGTKSMFKGKPDKKELIKPIASAHPNPAKDMIYVNWRLPEGMTPRAISLVIFNGQGVQLLTRSIINEVGIEEINTVNWPSGLYIYQLLHDNKPIHNGKFEVLR